VSADGGGGSIIELEVINQRIGLARPQTELVAQA